MDIIVLLQQAVLNHASDIFVVAGLPVSYRANGRICREKEEKLMPPQTKECVEELYKLAGGRDIRVLEEKQRMEQMPKGSIHERLAWGIKKSEMENQQRKKNKSKNREMER